MSEIVIAPLSADRFEDLAALFEQGGDPKTCWYYCDVGTSTTGGPSDDSDRVHPAVEAG